jgi:cytochrome P450
MPMLNPLIWGENAETVDPTRWSRLTEIQRSPYAFATFSNGPRICIAQGFALLEIKTIMVEMIRHYRFISVEKPFTYENPSYTLKPVGLEIRLERI